MTNAILRCLFALLLVIFYKDAVAQTFYEIEYTDKQGYVNRGLMIYYDEEDCQVVMRRHTSDGKDLTISQLKYESVKEDADGTDYLVMACEEDNTPLFIWIWDKSEEQDIPYVALNENDDTDKWVRASHFSEDKLIDLSPEYLQLFLDPECELYKSMEEAYGEIVNNLDDGTAVYQTIYNAVAEAKADDDAQATEKSIIGSSSNKKIGNTCKLADRPTMHLFVVANTEVADIGQACSTDYKNIVNEMRGISQSIGIRLKQYLVTGENYSKAGVQRQLRNLQPKSNDIVMFLYTGHGFRFDNQTDPYPMIALTTNDYEPIEGNYMAMSDIYKTIVNKGARLNIVLSDCCNAEVGERRPLGSSTLFSRGSNNYSRKRLNDLFFNSKGSILSTAASPGEYSWCDMSGGIFTLSFIQSLRKEISAMNKASVSWQSIVNNTLNTARKRSTNNARTQNGLKKVTVSKI